MENIRKVPKVHPALDKLYEYVSGITITPEMRLYIQYLLEAVCEGSVWNLRIGNTLYEIQADILETDE